MTSERFVVLCVFVNAGWCLKGGIVPHVSLCLDKYLLVKNILKNKTQMTGDVRALQRCFHSFL